MPSKYRLVLEPARGPRPVLARGGQPGDLSLAGGARGRLVEHFDLAEEARLRPTASTLAKRLGIELDAWPGPIPSRRPRVAPSLAVRNVVTNAIGWSPPGKTVEVHANACPGAQIVVDDAGPGVALARARAHLPPHSCSAATANRRVLRPRVSPSPTAPVRVHGGRSGGSSPLGGAPSTSCSRRRPGVRADGASERASARIDDRARALSVRRRVGAVARLLARVADRDREEQLAFGRVLPRATRPRRLRGALARRPRSRIPP
mgnify:CR=1 FL=1